MSIFLGLTLVISEALFGLLTSVVLQIGPIFRLRTTLLQFELRSNNLTLSVVWPQGIQNTSRFLTTSTLPSLRTKRIRDSFLHLPLKGCIKLATLQRPFAC